MTDPVGWTCPLCGQAYDSGPDPAGMMSCPAGHRAYSGYLAEQALLRARLAWLDERVLGGEVRPDDATAKRYGIWPTTAPPSGAGPVSAPGGAVAQPYGPGTRERQPIGAQVVLLGLGAALLIIAAIVFTAVVWDRLEAVGKVGMMGLVTLGCGALAIRLRRRLPGTAEALAVVTFGLTAVDVVAAPSLGLVPEAWSYPNRAYLAVMAATVGGLFAWLGRRAALRAWCWLGWATVALAAGLLTWWLMSAPLRDQPGRALSLSVLTLSTVALMAASYRVTALGTDRTRVRLAGVLAGVLALCTLPVALYGLERPALVGTAVTLLITAAAVLALARFAGRVYAYVSATLAGAAGGLLLLALPETRGVWTAAAAAVAGVVVLVGFVVVRQVRLGLVVSGVGWVTWGLGRLAIVGPHSIEDPVYLQLALVLGVAAVCWWVVAWRASDAMLAWPAAVLAWGSWLCVLPRLVDLPDVPEARWLPLGLFLLLGGWIWHRRREERSLAWLGPGVAALLLPSAIACWGAPWVYPFSDESTGEALTRLLVVLAAGLLVVAGGVARRLGGLLVPGATALAVVAAAQLWGGAQAMPRWIALGLAGVVLIVLGARVEWLRRGGRQAKTYLSALD